jgi:hypothetical protein
MPKGEGYPVGPGIKKAQKMSKSLLKFFSPKTEKAVAGRKKKTMDVVRELEKIKKRKNG